MQPESSALKRVIIDGDWGGDEMQLAAVLLAHHDDVTVLGATAVFGNAAHSDVLRNAGDVLSLLNAEDIQYHPGAEGPTGRQPLAGDGAHGANGVGGILLPQTTSEPQHKHAVDYILETLKSEPRGTVTITATGPLTNVAQAYTRDQETMARVKEIVIMGGCTELMAARDMPERGGNITPSAEFNFYMAAQDAQTVMNSGLPITLLPMNCTHQLTFTPERKQMLFDALAAYPDKRDVIINLITAPADLDQAKFGLAPVMHDVHTALYLVRPELYAPPVPGTIAITLDGELRGHSEFTPSDNGNVRVMQTLRDPNAAFTIVLDSIKHCLNR